MKRLLAIDTSTWWGSVALVEGAGSTAPRRVAALTERVTDSHAERLLRWIDALLAEAGWSKAGLDGFAATRGPGSFTGIRVGLGTIRGLSLATDRPCFGITTLRALAEAHGRAEAPRMPVMDAGRHEVYVARYDADSSPPQELEPPRISPLAALLAEESTAAAQLIPGPGTVLEGDGALRVAEAPACVADAVGRLALGQLLEGCTSTTLAPLYIRPPDAILKQKRR